MREGSDAAALATTVRNLKEEHQRKVRSLMSSIDNLEKQLAVAKALRNDTRRQQMIPLFRQKIKEQELTIDVLKHALCKPGLSQMTMKEVDEFIIRHTLGGPKRFRPASREELELRIASLEQQLKHAQAQHGTAAPKARQQPVAAETPQSKHDDAQSVMSEIIPEHWDADERERLYLLVQSKDELLHRQDKIITELRAMSSSDSNHCAQCHEYEADLRAIQMKYDNLQSTHHGIVRQYDEVQEQLDQACAQAELDKEDSQLELEALREQVERLLERNAVLLGEIQAKEEELTELTQITRRV